MARRTKIVLEDDLTGEVLEEGRGETVSFGLDGTPYEIDLSGDNSAELRQALKRYIDAGRKAGSGSRRSTASTPRSAAGRRSREDTAAIRAWARESGHEVSERGRIPATIIEAYEAAH